MNKGYVTNIQYSFAQIPYLDTYANETFENDCFIDHEFGKTWLTNNVAIVMPNLWQHLIYIFPPYSLRAVAIFSHTFLPFLKLKFGN